MPSNVNISPGDMDSDMSIGSISSDVVRKTAISVPSETVPAAKRDAIAPEKPHCGISPKQLPSRGPAFPEAATSLLTLLPALCSIISMSRYVINNTGKIFNVSNRASRKASNIIIPLIVIFPAPRGKA